MRIAVVTGNPKPASRTHGVALAVARALAEALRAPFGDLADGVPGAQVMANANASGGLALAKDYWVNFPDGYRAHQIRLEGGDCSTDSFCYPSV